MLPLPRVRIALVMLILLLTIAACTAAACRGGICGRVHADGSSVRRHPVGDPPHRALHPAEGAPPANPINNLFMQTPWTPTAFRQL